MSNSKSKGMFDFFDTIPFTSGALVWFGLLALTLHPDNTFGKTMMLVNIAFASWFASRTVVLVMRSLEHKRPVAAAPQEVSE